MLWWSTFGSDYSLESSWVWRYKLGTPVFGEFLPFFSADPLKLCQVGWERCCTAIFRSLLICLIGFKSSLRLGHLMTFRVLSQSYSCVVLAVCLGVLSCWRVNFRPSLRSWALWSILDKNLLQITQDISLGQRFTFQQDNDPKHTAKTTQGWLLNKSLNGVALGQVSSQRPDLNTIKYLWRELKKLFSDAPHPTWQSLRGSAENNGRNSPNTGVPSL